MGVEYEFMEARSCPAVWRMIAILHCLLRRIVTILHFLLTEPSCDGSVIAS